VLGHRHVYNDERTRLHPLHQIIKRPCLRNGPRKTVEYEAVAHIWPGQPLCDDGNHRGVIDQLTAVHPGLCLERCGVLLSDGFAQDVAR
jgi:hypothetical protein